MDLRDVLDIAGLLRYGMPTSEKERLAISGTLPGAPVDHTADQDAANRYAAGYLFAKEHPILAPIVQPMVNRLKVSDLPLFGGSTPDLQSQATAGMNQGLAAAGGRGPDLGALLAALAVGR